MRSVRLQLLVTIVATVAAVAAFVMRGWPPREQFENAAGYRSLDEVRRGLNWGAGSTSGARCAVRDGSTTVLEYLLEHGPKPSREELNDALHKAAVNGYPEAAEVLLAHGADVNARDSGGDSPLCLTAICLTSCIVIEGERPRRFGETAAVLLKHGADPNCRNRDRNRPLDIAIRSDGAKVVEALLKHGIDPNALDYDACTPLLRAAIEGHSRCVAILLDHGADVDCPDSDGRTPLSLVASGFCTDNIPIATLLMAAGAKVNALDKKGRSALYYAITNQQSDAVKHLIVAGANVNAVDKDGRSLLCYAVAARDTAIVEQLIAAGVEINARGPEGLTALGLAMENDWPEMAALLRQNGGDQ